MRARADFEAAARLTPSAPLSALRRAAAYTQTGRFETAIGLLEAWVAAYPKDARMPEALNSLCWNRATAGRELDKAMGACNAALKLRPGAAAFLDSRALVELRLGQLDSALADYDAALKARPSQAWSLYGRGLTKRKRGDKAGGDADIAAAIALDAKTPEEAKRYGLAS